MMSEQSEALKAQIDKMRKDIAQRAKDTHSSVENAISQACLMVQRSAVLNMKNTQTNPDVSYGKRGHHPSVPGDAPAPDMGTLMRSVTFNIVKDGESKVTGYVGSVILDPPYPVYLENGTSKMLPRPWLAPAVDENRDAILKLLSDGAQGREVSVSGNIDVPD